MQSWYVGTYTLMKHQHIHGNGVLAKRFPYNVLDLAFPYITDPLVGHTWNSYYYHHVKHHHVEGNGPNDLSSTIRYQRDDPLHFAHYVGRFFILIWLELPLYFLRKHKGVQAFKAAFWELSNLSAIVLLARFDFRPTLFVFVLPLLLTRVGLMVGNWGQHAFVDEKEPDSDFRSSITLIDVPVISSQTST
jgi:fatty acid desaturase